MKHYFNTLTEYKQFGHRTLLAPWAQLIENLRGDVEDTLALTGSYMNESLVINEFEQYQTVKNRGVVLMLHHARQVLLYLCQEHERAEHDRKLHEKIPPWTSSTYIFNLTHSVFLALNAYALAISTGQRKHLRRIRSYVSTIKSFGKAGSPNVPPLLALMEAESLTFRRKHEKAELKYHEAIEGFQRLEFFLLEAVAFERLAMSLTSKDLGASREALTQAHQKFSEYGATVKVRLLERRRKELDESSGIDK